MNWSDDSKDTIIIDGKDVLCTIVGDLAVHRSMDGWRWSITHVPTLTSFNRAIPGEGNKQQLVRWCEFVQSDKKELWDALRTLTPENYIGMIDVKDQMIKWCRSVKVK